ncbi:MAG: hypothetical protein N2442_08870 [Spirochaetes bacterium]|nr:hypothetical protein [Spirochaetota bacterium]
MKDLIEILEEESEKLGILPPCFLRYNGMIGFITGLYHGKGNPLEKDPINPKGSIGAFAQRNYYRILVNKVKALLHTLQLNGFFPKGAGRIYCNSRFPEKSFALASGFGVRGKNSLVIVPSLGTFLVLGGVLFPASLFPRGWAEMEKRQGLHSRLVSKGFPLCENCKACQEACPTGALEQPGIVDPSRCLQAYASHPYIVPEKIAARWGTLFYGCDVCQVVCPHNTVRYAPNSTLRIPLFDTQVLEPKGYLGGGIDLGTVLETPDEQLRKGIFRHSVLDIAWITPQTLKRNALLALSHQPVSSDWITPRKDLLEKYRTCSDPILRFAAEYTMKKIRNKIL